MSGLVTNPEVVGPWVCERGGGSWSAGRGQTLGWERGGSLVAGTLYEDWNGANLMTHISLDGPLDRRFVWAMFAYPFLQVGARRITGVTASTNDRVNRLLTKLGFTLEATLRGAHPTGDLLVWRMSKADCKWLTLLKAPHGEGQFSLST